MQSPTCGITRASTCPHNNRRASYHRHRFHRLVHPPPRVRQVRHSPLAAPSDVLRPELDLLPPDLRAASASDREIVLAPALAVRAIGVLVQAGYTGIGWEAWVRHADGSLGHPTTVIGTADLVSPEEAKSTIADAASQWHGEQELLICLTPGAANNSL